jgi:hypothetical protein
VPITDIAQFTFSMSGSFHVLSSSGFSGPYIRNRTSNFPPGVIHVRQRADAWGQMEPPKSKAGKRHIPLAPLVLNTLRERRIDCPKGA